MDKDMPAAVVENAAAGRQRKFLGTVTTLPEIVRINNLESPAVIIIGRVCRFSDRYDWFGRKPLRGKRVAVASIKYGTSRLSDALRELGCDVVEIPCLKIVPLICNNIHPTIKHCTYPTRHCGLDPQSPRNSRGSRVEPAMTMCSNCAISNCFFNNVLTDILKDIDDYSWIVFTSGVGVNIFFDYLRVVSIDIRVLINIKIACVGIETEKEVNGRGIMVDFVPEEYNGVALGRGLSILIKDGERALIPRAKDGDSELTRVLTEAGIAFDDVPIYEKVKDDKMTTAINENDFDFAAFTSPSAVNSFAENYVNMDFTKIKAVCIGEKTASAARVLGMEVCVSTSATIDSMVEKIKELCA
ncbi:uroporphyrinogen III methyltransferase [Fibrobacteres bacterium R8-0-B4]